MILTAIAWTAAFSCAVETRAPSVPALPQLAVGLSRPAEAAAPAAAGDCAALPPVVPMDSPIAEALQFYVTESQRVATAWADAAAAFEGQRAFDGAASSGERPQPPVGAGWTREEFQSADGLAIAYKRDGSPDKPARIFSGGLALNESFEPLFVSRKEPGSQFFLWTRGHPPTGWTPTKNPIDADARDLARLIVRAARTSRTGKAELVLHSFGTLVFQRLVQLRGEPEAAEALERLRGSRVVLLNATTHYPGSEKQAGPEFERMGNTTRGFVDWLDRVDEQARRWERVVESNPWATVHIRLWLDQWYLQRARLIRFASRGAADMMHRDLEQPWPALDYVRRELLKALEHDVHDPGWQEALLRRSRDMFTLDVTKSDVEAIRKAGIRLELVHAAGDQLLNWPSAKALFELLGIAAPAQPPRPGALLTDESGFFRARVVDGDHYFPLKHPERLAEILDP